MSIINTGTGEKSPEPFRMAATYFDMGLSVFPCAGEDGKTPRVKWRGLQKRRVGGKTLDKWLASFAGTNIAIVTGKLSGITVIDVDNPNIALTELFDKYGETPLVVATPRGGYHLYYKFNGEGCSQDAAQKIDIRGEGGYIIAPPSFNRTTGEVYHFIEGGIWEIPNLPFIKNNSEIQCKYSEGERNNKLFRHLIKNANPCYNLAMLAEVASTFNQQHLSPLIEETELQRTVKSVWGYKEKGTLYQGGIQWLHIAMSDKLRELQFAHPPAFALYIDLLSCHAGLRDNFAISPRSYATRAHWGEKTIREARKRLIEYGLIECTHKGGSKNRDVSLFSFTAWG